MAVKLKVKEFNEAIKIKGWSDTEASAIMGISTVQLWRVRLPDDDPRHNDPGGDFIANTMVALDKKFEDLFFLSDDLRVRSTGKENSLKQSTDHSPRDETCCTIERVAG